MWGITTLIGSTIPGTVKERTSEERLQQAALTAETATDSGLARQLVNSTDSIERRAYLRELIWRWRDYTETERPWKRDPEYIAWWE